MKKIFFLALMLAGFTTASAQVGIGTTSPAASSILDLTSTDKALLISRVASPASVVAPTNGMIIYDTTSQCFKGYLNGKWSGCNFGNTNDPSTNGDGVVSAYSCSTATAGTLYLGTPVSGVTQTITATVVSVGTYSISTTVGGVTFAASGTFAGTGAQNIVLTASGTPTTLGANNFTLATTPGCSFSRTVVNNDSTNGSGVVTSYTCSTASAGTLTAGTPVSGVTQTITANVTQLGTYNISAIANGVTFNATGTFTVLGSQNIVLTASGTPTAAGSNSFALNVTPGCSFDRITTGSVTPLPANIVLKSLSPQFIASAFDQDFAPYTTPTQPATLVTPVAADGVNESSTLNIQGSITTTGITINIPYTVTTASVSLPAFSQTIVVPASYTEDGISRSLTFSYSAVVLGVGTGNVVATVKSVGGTLNLKKLDLQTGI